MATSSKKNTLHVKAPARKANDKARADIAGTIHKMAPQSPLYAQHPEIQLQVANIDLLVAALQAADGDLAHYEAQAKVARQTRDTCRTRVDKAVGFLRSTVQNVATTPEEAAASIP